MAYFSVRIQTCEVEVVSRVIGSQENSFAASRKNVEPLSLMRC